MAIRRVAFLFAGGPSSSPCRIWRLVCASAGEWNEERALLVLGAIAIYLEPGFLWLSYIMLCCVQACTQDPVLLLGFTSWVCDWVLCHITVQIYHFSIQI
ncbi:hypothetical protein AAFF_G00290260 [Aldrovandia affinis]|uniref:Uncharacterized protein n=1 Tax=Aldrovandia affinis TaxID=143900 RepID=A0AAD7RA54_9TELE|nr:hypothetical protein AAFF_G00290260 [Aldrovandia affinis]